jgi:hypothetical protein
MAQCVSPWSFPRCHKATIGVDFSDRVEERRCRLANFAGRNLGSTLLTSAVASAESRLMPGDASPQSPLAHHQQSIQLARSLAIRCGQLAERRLARVWPELLLIFTKIVNTRPTRYYPARRAKGRWVTRPDFTEDFEAARWGTAAAFP